MPDVVISFVDGEVLHASVEDLSFDLPVISAEIHSIDPNCELALFPLAAIRQLIVGDVRTAPDPSVLDDWDRSAFHFADGQVLRAWISPDAVLGQHGGVWEVVEADGLEKRTLAIPYSALKGVYRLRQWDSRTVSERGTRESGVDQLARVLSEREVQGSELPAPRRTLISRIRGKIAP